MHPVVIRVRHRCHLGCDIHDGYRTEWSPIRSVIIQVIMKLNNREAGVQFVNHEYDYRPTSDDMKSHYQLIISITISHYKCLITCKCPINALIGGLLTNQIQRNCNTYD